MDTTTINPTYYNDIVVIGYTIIALLVIGCFIVLRGNTKIIDKIDGKKD